MVYSIFQYENQFVESNRGVIAGIPFLSFRPKGFEGDFPTVIYYHGWSSSKEFKRFQASVIASYGFHVIAPDAIFHGERNPIDYNKPQMLDKYFWKAVIQTIKESKDLIEGIVNKEQADPNRIGVMGSSMGGFIASAIFVQQSEIKCLINVNGASAWTISEDSSEKRIPNLLPELEPEIYNYDPVRNLEKLHTRPVLLLHGDADTSIPIEIQRFFYTKAKPFYNDYSEKLQLLEYPRMNHYTSTGMLEKIIEWNIKYL